MRCPYCDAESVKVLETRQRPEGATQRVRQCPTCAVRFTTVERISAYDVVVHKSGRRPREKFSKTKLRKGIEKAAAVWTLSAQDLDSIVDRVVKRLRPAPGMPVSSKEVGDIVLHVLEGDDPAFALTRIRFAIVFRGGASRRTQFRTVDDFIGWLESEYEPPELRSGERRPSVVLKRDGQGVPFVQGKLERSIGIASKGRGSDEQVKAMATSVADEVINELSGQAIVTSQQIASEALKVLRRRDPLAYLRYASAVKRYRSVYDFWLEAHALKD